jgi:hypothetical protein
MKSSLEIATNSSHRSLHKLEHYFEHYDHYFSKYRNKPVRVLEIGVAQGGGLDLWKEFFGKEAKIMGLDNDPSVRQRIDSSMEVAIFDQEDREGLIELFSGVPPFDIIIDDGGHEMLQQIRSFEALFPLLNKGGTYLVEDVHTSYWNTFDGALRKEGTFIEFSKQLVDYVNTEHFRHPDTLDLYPPLKESLMKELTGVHFHDSMCFFQKGYKTKSKDCEYLGTGNVRYIGTLDGYI